MGPAKTLCSYPGAEKAANRVKRNVFVDLCTDRLVERHFDIILQYSKDKWQHGDLFIKVM